MSGDMDSEVNSARPKLGRTVAALVAGATAAARRCPARAGAAERDPRRFDNPDTFDVGRGDTAHIGFGGGIHFCVGAPLARQELEVSLAGLVQRFPDLQLAEMPVYQPNFVIRGLQGLRLQG